VPEREPEPSGSSGEALGDGGAAPTDAVPQAAAAPIDILDTPAAGRKVIHGSLFRIVGYGAGLLLGIVSAALLTRHLGVVDWGRYVTVTSLLAIVSGLSEAGMSIIGVREYSVLEGGERDRLMRNLLGIRLAITAVGVAIAVVFGIAARYDSVLIAGIFLGGVGLLLTMAQQTYSVPLSASLRLAWVSALDFLRQAVTAALVVALVVAGAGLLSFLATPIPVAILVLVLTVALVRGALPLRPAFEWGEWARVLRLTAAYAAASAIGTIYVSITVVLISLVGSGRETGYYGASFRVFSVLAVIPLLLVTSAFPVLARAARDDRERLDYARKRLLDTALIFGVWMAIALVLGARPAIGLVGGDDFDESVAVLRIQGLAIAATFVAVTLGFVLLSLRLHRALLLANAVALGLSLALTLALVPGHGARGAAIASVSGEFALAIGYAIALARNRARPEVSLRVAIGVGLAVAAALAVAWLTGLDGLPLVAAATGAYFAALALAGALPRELWEALPRAGSG
jgi:O-antigen/teichoic acid export membrane protein